MSDKIDTRVIQITNLAPSCSREQLKTLFSYLGRIKELQMYPPETVDITAVTARVAYLEFEDVTTTGVALHLSNTVFVDRALVIVPVMDGKIPDETTALRLTPQAVAGMLPGQPTWPANVVSQVSGTGVNQVITTFDPRLTSLGLPQYPPLSATIDTYIIEEIRRTIYVCNLDPKVRAEILMNFFSQVGEIKYVCMAGDEISSSRGAYIEFTDQRCVAQALNYNNMEFQGRTMNIQHSKTQIMKPQEKDSTRSPSRSKRSRSKSKGRSRSRSRARRSRSRSKGRRRRSRSRSKRRSRSKHRSPLRSKSPFRRRRSRSRGRVIPPAPSASRDRRRSLTRSPPVRRRRSGSGSKSRKKSRTPPKSYSKRSRSRSRKRSLSRNRRLSRSRDVKAKDKKKSASLSPPCLERNGSIPPKTGNKDGSPGLRNSSGHAEEDSGKAISKKSGHAEKDSGKASSKQMRSATPGKFRRRSPSPRKRSKSKSPICRPKRRRRTRSPLSPRKRSRSRSAPKHQSKRDRIKRSRSRDRKHESKRKNMRGDRDKDEKKKDSAPTKVKRDYDEEEKGFASSSEKGGRRRGGAVAYPSDDEGSASGDSPPLLDTMEKEDINHQTVDMDMSD